MKFKSLGKRIATVGLAGAMMMSMAMPVFADTYNNGTTDSSDDVTVTTDYTIHKTVSAASGVTVPESAVYTFSVAPQSGAPSVVTGDTITLNQSALTNNSGATDAIFSAADFSGQEYGVYEYKITETGITVNSQNASTTNWTKSSDEYTARVKYTADGIYVTIEKDGTKQADGASFTNLYTAYGNDNGNDGTQNPASLKITKTVNGEAYTGTESFSFTINVSSNGVVDTSKLPSYNGTTFAYDTDYTITLTSATKGTAVESDNISIPVGASYTIKETTTGATSTTVNGQTYDSTNGYTGTISSRTEGQTAAFVNTKDVNVLTGVVNQYGGLLMIVAIAAAGIVVLSIRRRREA